MGFYIVRRVANVKKVGPGAWKIKSNIVPAGSFRESFYFSPGLVFPLAFSCKTLQREFACSKESYNQSLTQLMLWAF